MTPTRLVLSGLRFYWRTHLGVAGGVAAAVAVLVGALVVGDCVRYSLRAIALARLGGVELALPTGDRLFRAALADDLSARLDAPAAPVLQLSGVAIHPESQARANRVQVLGVDERFWELGPKGNDPAAEAASGPANAEAAAASRQDPEGVVLNDALAGRLGVHVGDSVLIRVGKPSLLPLDAPLSTTDETTTALRLTVRRIVPREAFGHFSLRADQTQPLNAFVPLNLLQEKAGFAGRANLLLVGRTPGGPALTAAQAQANLKGAWQLADAGLELRELADPGVLELRSNRVFLDPPIAAALESAAPGAAGVLVYFVNELRHGTRATPYSLVAAVGPASIASRPASDALSAGLAGLADDEMLINTWLQEDLAARPDDEIDVRYYVMSAGRSLIERTHRFRVRGVVPMTGLAADADLMPDYPGFADAENCRDWEPGVPIDLDRIRDKDERYWDEHRGTPKAFINLATGRRLWGNRFGELTAIRYPTGTDTRDRIASAFRDRLDPAAIGFSIQPVRERALTAGGQGLDFGQLFLGFSFFLIAAALLLAGLLFALSVEQRAEEIGTLLALGFRPGRVRRLVLMEGGVLAVAGACVGTAVGALYTRAILHGLGTLWRGALGVASLQYHAETATLAAGFTAGVLVALATLALSVRRCARRPAATLLTGAAVTDPTADSTRGSRLGRAVAWPAFGLSAVILAHNAWRGERSSAGAFFAVGGLLLIGGLGLAHALLAISGRADRPERITLTRLASRNAARRRGRSLATLGMLACGSFLLVAIGANRHGPPDEPDRRSSGSGGFALFAEATLPIPHDLNTAAGRDAYGLTAEQLEGANIVSFRVREGDDASCLNPQRAQVPRLLGVDPAALQSRGSFTFVKTAAGRPERGWNLLNRAATDSGDTVPAIGDQATVTWGLHKKVGDLIPLTDEQGRTFSLCIVGVIANSVLQGSLLISERDFVARFPGESGYRAFLIDVRPQRAAEVSNALSRALQDRGLDLTATTQRLAVFNVVENTYLSIFQVLGGLGLLLGCGGLGMVVARNVLERRGELAILRAVGFSRRSLQWFVLSEHGWLLLAGLSVGALAGLVAVVPALLSPGAQVPVVSIALTVLAVAAAGAAWAWAATLLALRGPLLPALWNE